MFVVECRYEFELFSLAIQGKVAVADIGDELVRGGVLAVDVGALVHTRKESRTPVLRGDDGVSAGTHHDESSQIAVLAAKTIRHPTAETRARLAAIATVHQEQGGFVV